MRISDWSSDVCSSDLKAWEREVGLFQEREAALEADVLARRQEVAQALRQEWGQAFDTNLALAQKAVVALGGADLLAELNEAGLGDSPAVLRMFAKIGAMTAEEDRKSTRLNSSH